MNELKLPQINCETVCKEIGDFIIDRVKKIGIHRLYCGIVRRR